MAKLCCRAGLDAQAMAELNDAGAKPLGPSTAFPRALAFAGSKNTAPCTREEKYTGMGGCPLS